MLHGMDLEVVLPQGGAPRLLLHLPDIHAGDVDGRPALHVRADECYSGVGRSRLERYRSFVTLVKTHPAVGHRTFQGGLIARYHAACPPEIGSRIGKDAGEPTAPPLRCPVPPPRTAF